MQTSLFDFGTPPQKDSYLFFDTETTGLPRNWNARAEDVDNWPRLVQLAWIQYDENGNVIASENKIVRPDGYTIPADSSRIHGITTERALAEGIPVRQVLETFCDKIGKSTHIVAHNIDFDEKIIGAEFIRAEMNHDFQKKKKICTMKSTVDFCAIPSPRGYKWPQLSELHTKLFGEPFKDAHDASVDIAATAKCFWELKKRGVL
ncbi:MAG: 3'-5' exonuclease [Candidatus Paceibacterota bacterium]|jgi:DNA polymerase III epsilon subunit-like protein|nr:3'-5' exonuclease [Candidatus Paceibacterota bacterium]